MKYYIYINDIKHECIDYADMTNKFWLHKFSGDKVETEVVG